MNVIRHVHRAFAAWTAQRILKRGGGMYGDGDPLSGDAWRNVATGSGLLLHAAAATLPWSEGVDVKRLQQDYAALDAAVPDDRRNIFGSEGWVGMSLYDSPPVSAPRGTAGAPGREMAHAPYIRDLLARAPWRIMGCQLVRQPPYGCLRWHFDGQALHLAETRLLMPIHAPPEAETLIGDESVAYPEGTLWTGDFSFPHQVNNPGDRERIVLLIDVVSDDSVRAHFPPALYADPARRIESAQTACNALSVWRSFDPARYFAYNAPSHPA